MKTKEIAVWIRESDFKTHQNGGLTECTYWEEHELSSNVKYLECKIIINLPEPETIIKPADFERAWDTVFGESINPRDKKNLLIELFKEGN